MKEIYETGDLKYPLKDAEFILKVKKGELDFTTEVKPVLESLVAEVKELVKTVNLPAKPDIEFWNNFVYGVYGGAIYENYRNFLLDDC